jgi:gamma-glutamyltranspeptidase/glutathione hydrolase
LSVLTVMLKRASRIASLAVLSVCALAVAPRLPAQPVTATEQLVVAANPHAVEAGISILRAGGSAVDAAIAIQAVLSMVEPQSSGIGGGAFLLHYGAAGDLDTGPALTAYEGREAAPAAATPELFLDASGRPLGFGQTAWGGLPVGVPGVMRMLELAHADHGRLPWAELFSPAIALAERGFEITPRLYFLLDRFENAARARSFRAHYYDDSGRALVTGTRLVNPAYARTLRIIARDGAGAMYEGEIAEAIVAAVNGNSVSRGQLTLEDLRSYRARKSEPLCSPYRVWTICGPQLPSSGGVTTQQILGIAARFEFAPDDPVGVVHIIAEAGRLAFADRDFYLADPAFVSAPVADLLSPEYLDGRAALIDPRRARRIVEPGVPTRAAARNFASSAPSDLASTSHFSVVDRWGDAVAMTTSVQSTFGSQLMVGGFLLNNQLTDFSSEPMRDGRPIANRPDGGKRPLSSMSPTLVLDGDDRLRVVIGSPGGTRIIGFVAQALVGVLDLGMDIQEAVAAPHYLARYGSIEIEEDTSLVDLKAQLEALGHTVEVSNLNSGLHGIVIEYSDTGRTLYGGVDPRREGIALGD